MNEEILVPDRSRLHITWDTLRKVAALLVFSVVLFKIMPSSLFICFFIICSGTLYFARNNPRLFNSVPIFLCLRIYFPVIFGAMLEEVAEQPPVIEEEEEEEEDEFEEALEPVEEISFPILQILDKTVSPSVWNREEYPANYDCKLHTFRTEKVDKVMSSFTQMTADERPTSHHLVFLFSGKVSHNSVDVKLYRFCVKRAHTTRLWYYLNKATQFVPENVKQLWIENSTPEEQDRHLKTSVNSLADSGFDSDDMLLSQSMLHFDGNQLVWRFNAERDDDVDYIYYLTKALPCLRWYANQDRSTNRVDANYGKNKGYLLKLAQYVQKLHVNGIAHGFLSLRNVLVFLDGFEDTSLFLHSESVFYLEHQFTGNMLEGTDIKINIEKQAARSRRKYFDKQQRDDPSDFNKSCDVFAIGLFVMELLCAQSDGMQKEITKRIREYQILSHVLPDRFPEYQRCWDEFGPLLERILVPRDQRATIDVVVDYLANHLE